MTAEIAFPFFPCCSMDIDVEPDESCPWEAGVIALALEIIAGIGFGLMGHYILRAPMVVNIGGGILTALLMGPLSFIATS